MNNQPYAILGLLIKNHREEHGLGVRGLSALSGVSPGRISQYESGRLRPRPANLEKLTRVLDIDFATAMRAAGYPQPELPKLQIYLRSAYGLTPDGAADVERYIRDNHGPVSRPHDGEDELPL